MSHPAHEGHPATGGISIPSGIQTHPVYVRCNCPRGGRVVNLHITQDGVTALQVAISAGISPDLVFETWWCRGCKSTVPITLRHLHAA